MNNDQIISGDGPLLNFLLTQQSLAVMLFVFGSMLLFMVAEQLAPRIDNQSVPAARWLTNWLLAFLNYFGALWLMSYLGAGAWIQSRLPDLQATEGLPTMLVIAMLIVSVEFIIYWSHRLFHTIPALWHIHAVHHMDTELDVTTSHRHHLLEVLFTALLITPLFVLLGGPVWIAFGYQLLRILIAQFNHSNLRVPQSLEKLLRPLIVTPAYHRVHHSTEPSLTNSNYGTVVPWFDYLFGTARMPEPETSTAVGLRYLRDARYRRLDRILLLPFMWRHWKISSDS